MAGQSLNRTFGQVAGGGAGCHERYRFEARRSGKFGSVDTANRDDDVAPAIASAVTPRADTTALEISSAATRQAGLPDSLRHKEQSIDRPPLA